ncbi:MAG: diguanylate cyclase [Thiovulaceae bacterium]|nr:diguanylate cyclase [Sulfurimonadaceae bacterium]
MLTMSRELLQSTLSELDQAVYDHDQRYKELMRSVVCKIPPDQHELSEDAHRNCRFGQWYYTMIPPELHTHPSYLSLEAEHKLMNRLGSKLLIASISNAPISIVEYDNFAAALDRMRLNIATLKDEIEETLYTRDPLTGVRNRVSMLSDLRYVHEMVERHTQDVAIAILDIDHFKKINDNYGHPIGDKVLSMVAKFLMEHTRPCDKVYRYGVEEFLVCMGYTDLQTAREVLDRLRVNLSHFSAVAKNGVAISVSASFGLSSLDADGSVDDAIIRADEALYVSKRAGRNMVTVWDSSMHAELK